MTPELNVNKIELSISCENLPKSTFISTHALTLLYIKEKETWTELGRTEIIKDSENPKFVKKFVIEYHFSEIQTLKFKLYDVASNQDLSKIEYTGETECLLSDILTSKNKTLVKALKHPLCTSDRGLIKIEVETVNSEFNYSVRLQFGARNLDNLSFFGKSDPFLVISRSNESGNWTPVCKSETVSNSLNPTWSPMLVSAQKLCNGDMKRPLLFEVFDFSRTGNHTLIGSATTDLETLSKLDEVIFNLINIEMRKKKSKYTNSGLLNLVTCQMTKEYNFLDYIVGGCELGLIVAIDFTASNGDPHDPTSLHYDNPQTPNEYVKAILSVGEILANYDSDRLFPVFGFGAKVPPQTAVSHCFPLTFNPAEPAVAEIQGILKAYQLYSFFSF